MDFLRRRRGFGEEPEEAVLQLPKIVGIDEDAELPMAQRVHRGILVAPEAPLPAAHRLKVDDAEPFPLAGHGEGVGHPVVVGQLLAGDEPGEDHAVAKTQPLDLALNVETVISAANEEKLKAGDLAGEVGEDLQNLAVSLVLFRGLEAGDTEQHLVRGTQSVLLPEPGRSGTGGEAAGIKRVGDHLKAVFGQAELFFQPILGVVAHRQDRVGGEQAAARHAGPQVPHLDPVGADCGGDPAEAEKPAGDRGKVGVGGDHKIRLRLDRLPEEQAPEGHRPRRIRNVPRGAGSKPAGGPQLQHGRIVGLAQHGDAARAQNLRRRLHHLDRVTLDSPFPRDELRYPDLELSGFQFKATRLFVDDYDYVYAAVI